MSLTIGFLSSHEGFVAMTLINFSNPLRQPSMTDRVVAHSWLLACPIIEAGCSITLRSGLTL